MAGLKFSLFTSIHELEEGSPELHHVGLELRLEDHTPVDMFSLNSGETEHTFMDVDPGTYYVHAQQFDADGVEIGTPLDTNLVTVEAPPTVQVSRVDSVGLELVP